MRCILYLLCCIGLLLPTVATAQKSKQPATVAELLVQATSLREQNTQEAISLVERAIEASRAQKDTRYLAQAYTLLGDIFVDIKQDDAAIQRYRQALRVVPLKRDDLTADLLQRIGQAQLRQQQAEAAIQSFEQCLTLPADAETQLSCSEGLADANVQQKDWVTGLQLYNSIQQQSPADSFTYSRIEAKKSEVYARRNDRVEAEQSYRNAINTLPDQQLSTESFEPLAKANDAYVSNFSKDLPNDLKLNTIVKRRSTPLPEEPLIRENLQLASRADTSSDTAATANYLAEARAAITPGTSLELRAEVYRRSSDYYLDRQDIANAQRNYRNYTAASEQILQTKQAELDRQIDIVLRQQQIDLGEKEAALLAARVRTQNSIIVLLSLLLLGALAAVYVVWRNVRRRQRANQLLHLRSLQTQMNPHFVFNALNSINNFIARHDERAANKFLGDFAKLMRLVLDQSKQDFIPLEEEVQLLQLYLKLEQLRFRDKFTYTLDTPALTQHAQTPIPPLLVQPFIENAIWHGLRYKDTVGELHVRIAAAPEHLTITVQDNGIGRTRSLSHKTRNQQRYQSTGLANTEKRAELIDRLYQKKYTISLADAHPDRDATTEDVGTLVTIKIPITP